MPDVQKFYYWKDDWVYMWVNKYKPEVIFNEFGTSGKGWEIKSGVFMLPYARLWGQISPETHQRFGIVLKFLNSAAVMLLVYTFIKNKRASILSGLLYAGYSGGVEAYTWHRITALAMGFSVLAFSFHNLFLEKKKIIYLIGLIICVVLALFSYFGRAIGLLPLFAISIISFFYIRPSKFLLKYLLLTLIAIFGIVFFVRDSTTNVAGSATYSQMISISLPHLNILFGNMGNLLRVPLFKLADEGGLVGAISPLSLFLGKGFLVLTGIVLIGFILTRKIFLQKLLIIFFWMFLMYIPSWIYAGGGPTVMVSSSHRYMAGMGIGFILVIGMILSKLSKLKQLLVFTILLVSFVNYSTYAIGFENELRNANIVKPFYEAFINDTANDPLPRALIVHTTVSDLVTGWLPYAYSYFKGIKNYNEFPTVFSNKDAAAEWVCAPEERKGEIASKYGAPDYQKGRPILKSNIHAWSISGGKITNETDIFKAQVSKCI